MQLLECTFRSQHVAQRICVACRTCAVQKIHVAHRLCAVKEVLMKTSSSLKQSFHIFNFYFYSQAQKRASLPKPKPQKECVEQPLCESDLGRMFTKSRGSCMKKEDCPKNCLLTEYMDKISRTGAGLLEKQNQNENDKMSQYCGKRN